MLGGPSSPFVATVIGDDIFEYFDLVGAKAFAVVLLDHDPTMLHIGEDRFRERLQSYLEIAEALRERVPDIDYVDLRFEQRVYVKPRGRADSTAMQLPAAGKTF